jgi:hypothetical protein
MTHVPCGRLAALWRAGEDFPALDEPCADGGYQHVLAAGGWDGELVNDGSQVRFWCPDCSTLMFQPNTARGHAHALKVALAHKPDCCRERAERFAGTGEVTAWPDSEDE